MHMHLCPFPVYQIWPGSDLRMSGCYDLRTTLFHFLDKWLVETPLLPPPHVHLLSPLWLHHLPMTRRYRRVCRSRPSLPMTSKPNWKKSTQYSDFCSIHYYRTLQIVAHFGYIAFTRRESHPTLAGLPAFRRACDWFRPCFCTLLFSEESSSQSRKIRFQNNQLVLGGSSSDFGSHVVIFWTLPGQNDTIRQMYSTCICFSLYMHYTINLKSH